MATIKAEPKPHAPPPRSSAASATPSAVAKASNKRPAPEGGHDSREPGEGGPPRKQLITSGRHADTGTVIQRVRPLNPVCLPCHALARRHILPNCVRTSSRWHLFCDCILYQHEGMPTTTVLYKTVSHASREWLQAFFMHVSQNACPMAGAVVFHALISHFSHACNVLEYTLVRRCRCSAMAHEGSICWAGSA